MKVAKSFSMLTVQFVFVMVMRKFALLKNHLFSILVRNCLAKSHHCKSLVQIKHYDCDAFEISLMALMQRLH